MIRASTFVGKRVAVFGLGRSGASTVRALIAGGAEVAAWDDKVATREAASNAGVPVVDLEAADWGTFETLVLAPGVPLTHPLPHWTVTRAREHGVEVIGDVEIFARERKKTAPDSPFIAITGTNGKSTTTALIAHILAFAGRDVQMGGNIGVPALELEPAAPDRIHVLELSSYQIDLMPTLEPTVGILMNVSPDHIDRHGTFDNYAAIKARLPRSARIAIVCIDDLTTGALAQQLARTHPDARQFSARHRLTQGLYLDSGRIYRASDGQREALADLEGLVALRGAHNAQNVMAAYAALEPLGVDFRTMAKALPSFPGLPHRLEQVGRLGRTLFINDSKATNAESAAVALAAFPDGIHWICGGLAKEGGLAGLEPYFPRIAKAYLIGAAEAEFAEFLEGRIAVERCGTLERAIETATSDAAASVAEEPLVLLAPACASFDQFRSFEHRGDRFREIVAGIPGIRPGRLD